MPHTYFVSPSGSATASGRSESAALTPDAAGARLLDGRIGGADTVLLEHGTILNWKLRPLPGGYGTNADDPWLTIAGYGRSRKRPILSSYMYVVGSAAWTNTTGNLWRLDLSNNASFDAATSWLDTDGSDTSTIGSNSLDIGHLNIDGVIYGRRRLVSVDECVNQWDFHCDGTQYLTVYSVGNPSSVAGSIGLAPDGAGLRLVDGMRVFGIDVTGTGGHALHSVTTTGAGNRGSRRLFLRDVHGYNFGGSVLETVGGVRYGNGWELPIGAADVDGDCVFHDGYDVGFTAQSPVTAVANSWERIKVRLTQYRMTQNLEFWATGSTAGGAGWRDIYIDGRFMAPGGWGARDRNTGGPTVAVHLLGYGWDLPVENFVIDGQFYGRYDDAQAAFSAQSRAGSLAGITFGANFRLAMPAGSRLRNQIGTPSPAVEHTTQTIEQFASWRDAAGFGPLGRGSVLPSSTPADVGRMVEQISADALNVSGRVQAVEQAARRDVALLAADVARVDTLRSRAARSVSNGSQQFLPIARLAINGATDRSSLLLSYAEAGDGSTRTGAGLLHAVIYASSSGNLQIALTISELMPFLRTSDGSSLRPHDFAARVTATDDAFAFEVTVYVQARDTFQRLHLREITSHLGAGSAALLDEAPAIAALPANASAAAPTNTIRRYTMGALVDGTNVTIAKTWGTVAAGAVSTQTYTVNGAQVGDYALASMSIALPSGVLLHGQVTAANTVTVTLYNLSGSEQTIGAGSLRVGVIPAPSGA